MRKDVFVMLAGIVFLSGCSNADSLSKKAITQFVNDNYSLSDAVRLDKIRVYKTELTNTDLNYKYYKCIGLVKLKCIADSQYDSEDGPINAGDRYYQLVKVKLNYKQGATGEIETGLFERQYVNSKSGK